MGVLSDFSHLFGNDLAVTPTGDIALVSQAQLTIQRVVRRLCTPSTTIGNSAYPWEPSYGAGLPQKIGSTFTPSEIQAIVLGQILQEASVAPSPAPTVTVTPIASGGATIDIFCFDRSGTPQNFSFDLA
jgi:hypothetical protein